MPHVVVKIWPGKSERQKQALADAIIKSTTSIIGYGDEVGSVAMVQVSAADWTDKVYTTDIVGQADQLYKKPGYGSLAGGR